MNSFGNWMYLLPTLVAATFVSRWAPRLRWPDAIGSDSYFHLFMAHEIRRRGHRLPPEVPRVLVCPRYTYPFLYHWILSFVPRDFAFHAERISSAVIDAVYVLCTFFIALRLGLLMRLGEEAYMVALWAATLVAINPALLMVGAGPRAYGGSPRPLGELLFLVYLGLTILNVQEDQAGWFIGAAVAAAAGVITSKFFGQAALFMALLLCVFGVWNGLATLGAGILLAVVATGGRAAAVLRGQIAHSAFYFRYTQPRFLYRERRTLMTYCSAAWSYLKSLRRGPGPALRWIFVEPFLPHRLLVGYPLLLALPLLFVVYGAGHVLERPVAGLVTSVIAISLVVAVATALKPLLFLGEAERYVEYSIPFQAFLVAATAWLGDAIPILLIIVAYGVFAYISSVSAFGKVYGPWIELRRNFPTVVRQIDEEGAKVLLLGTVFWPTLFFSTRLHAYTYSGNLDARQIDSKSWYAIFGNFPYPGVPLQDLEKTAPFHYVLSTRSGVEAYERLLGDASLGSDRYPLVAAAGDVVAYRRADAPAGN